MPASRYVEENSLAAMLSKKRSAGVTPEVNLKECVTCTLPLSANKATLAVNPREDTNKSLKTGVSVASQKGLLSSKIL